MNRLERMLKDFDENQLREINKFLKLDPNEVKKRISGLSTADLMKIMKNL